VRDCRCGRDWTAGYARARLARVAFYADFRA
jgi:hypothetical protein